LSRNEKMDKSEAAEGMRLKAIDNEIRLLSSILHRDKPHVCNGTEAAKRLALTELLRELAESSDENKITRFFDRSIFSIGLKSAWNAAYGFEKGMARHALRLKYALYGGVFDASPERLMYEIEPPILNRVPGMAEEINYIMDEYKTFLKMMINYNAGCTPYASGNATVLGQVLENRNAQGH